MCDPACFQLAKYFLPSGTLESRAELGQHIQNEVESWIEDAAAESAMARLIGESDMEARRRWS